ILLLNLGSICSKMKVLLHGDSPFEWQVALSFYRRSASKGYFYACSSLSSTTGYYILTRKEPYRELGADYWDRQREARIVRQTVKRLEGLGYEVKLEKTSA
ncbi:hypothetical protein ABES20_14860, partial [Geobacillus stearothermophilus]